MYAYYSVDNFNDLKPYLTEVLCALDPATGSEIVLAEGAVYTFGPLRKLAGDALWWVDGTAAAPSRWAQTRCRRWLSFHKR